MGMMPEPNDNFIKIPVTFDYNGGRGDQRRGNVFTTLILIVVSIVLTLGVVKNSNFTIVLKIILSIGIWLLSTLYIRFRVFKELVYSDAYEDLKESDFTPDTKSFWKIYEIDSQYPYVHHFIDGKHAIFIRMNKDVVVGKPEDIVNRHYDAISEALNKASSLNLNVVQMDYMDNVGNDPRMDNLNNNLQQNCSRRGMQTLMMSMYSYWRECMMEDYATFDVYAFISKGSPEELWKNTQLCVSELMNGNYISSNALNLNGSRLTCMALFNFVDFSAIDACGRILENRKTTGIVPIMLYSSDGSKIKINKTQAELKADEEARKEAEYQEYLNKKNNTPVKRVKRSAKSIKERIDWSVAKAQEDKKKIEQGGVVLKSVSTDDTESSVINESPVTEVKDETEKRVSITEPDEGHNKVPVSLKKPNDDDEGSSSSSVDTDSDLGDLNLFD